MYNAVSAVGETVRWHHHIAAMAEPLTTEKLDKLLSDFEDDPKNTLATNICTRIDPYDACISRKRHVESSHVFTHKVESEGKPVTDQKSTGRCWIFSALNVMRLPFMKHHGIEEFEFSQAYLFYWNKIEQSHYWLRAIVTSARKNEPVDGRLMQFLLSNVTIDGGQWHMFVNLVNKHGLMPKKCFPESFSSETSRHMNDMIKTKLREYAKVLVELVGEKADDATIQAKIDEQMATIYKIVSICLGTPPKTFTWQYYNSKKVYNRLGPFTPQEFYNNHVKPVFDVNEKVCLVTDPRPNNPYNKLYTVDCLGNMIGGIDIAYNNQPVEVLMEMTANSIKSGEAVWFGCEVMKRTFLKLGLEDLEIHDFKLLFGTDFQTTFSKADRLIYGESCMTHAMAFTAVSIDDNGEAYKFRVENSWGEDRGEKGYLIITRDWFKEFVFEIVCDKKHVPESILKVFEQQPILLPAWDPMGTLAQ